MTNDENQFGCFLPGTEMVSKRLYDQALARVSELEAARPNVDDFRKVILELQSRLESAERERDEVRNRMRDMEHELVDPLRAKLQLATEALENARERLRRGNTKTHDNLIQDAADAHFNISLALSKLTKGEM